MQLERLSIALRPRNAWEAMDLGVRLVMQHARRIYAAWFALTLPCALVVIGGVGIVLDAPVWAVLGMWWLQPAFDRLVLYIVSHAVFDAPPGVRASLRALPRLLLRRSLFAALTWRRFSFKRSLLMPVEVLEGLSGAAARQRRALISRRVAGAAIWQSLAWSTLELVFTLNLFVLCLLLVPNELLDRVDWSRFFGQRDGTTFVWHIAIVVYVACQLLLEPIYVACGFMLYLKRRNDLEAWDVELQFRRIASRQGAQLLCAALVCGALFCGVGTREARADETVVDSPTAQSAAPAVADDPLRAKALRELDANLKRVMEQPEFGTEETHSRLRWRNNDEARRPWNLPDWLKSWGIMVGKAVAAIGRMLASLGRIGGWLGIGVIVLALVYVVLRHWRGLALPRATAAPPAALAGFDIRPQSLPADVAAVALQWLREGRSREAMSLLFRGALSVLAYRDHVPFMHGDTEGDCLDRVRRHAAARFTFLARLLGSWQQLAYAHEMVADSEIEALCAEWPRHFKRTENERGG